MARLNNFLKFIIFHVNFLFSLTGIGLIGLSIYILVSNWGQLDPGFFSGVGAVMLIAGYISSLASVMGNFGITHQRVKYGFWTGRRILFVYQVVLVAALIGIVYCIFISVVAVNSFKSTFNLLAAGQVAPFTTTEQYFSNKFNSFFFGAAYKTCPDAKYAFFWPFINSNCDPIINQQTCQKCYDYSITSCVADPSVCPTSGSGNSDPNNEGCPYTYCRVQILDFLISNINTFSFVAISIMTFAIVIMVTTCMLICYTERDSIDRQVFKSGTLANSQFANKYKDNNLA